MCKESIKVSTKIFNFIANTFGIFYYFIKVCRHIALFSNYFNVPHACIRSTVKTIIVN